MISDGAVSSWNELAALVYKAMRNTDLPLIIHTDRGSQYVSQAWREATQNMQRSYSHKGYPYDNACIESLPFTHKKEMA